MATKVPEKPGAAQAPDAAAAEFAILQIRDIVPSPLNPRKVFDQADLQELADSIREHGLQQPIAVRKREPFPDRYSYGIAPKDDAEQRFSILDNGTFVDGGPAQVAQVIGVDAASDWVELLNTAPYELIMGERRYRASLLAGLTTIPAMVHGIDMDDQRHLELALVENLQRRSSRLFTEG